jgi:hypothetical protein
MISMVQKDGMILAKYQQYRNNQRVVLAAVQQNGLALDFAGDTITSNKLVVTAAVQQNGLALRFADIPLRSDVDVVSRCPLT